MIKDRIFYILLVVGIALRVFLAITTYHSDLGAFALAGKYIAGEGKIWSFYDQAVRFNEDGSVLYLPSKMIFNYQPLAYILPSLFYLPFKGLILDTAEGIVNTNWDILHSVSVNWVLLLYKLPMIVADLAIVFMLAKFFIDQKKKRLAQILWIFNPLGIYVGSMMGQVDIMIAFWLVLALLARKNKKYCLTAAMVAISALIKPIGLILIPIVVMESILRNKNFWRGIAPGICGGLVYFLGILPYLGSPAYRAFSLFADQINKSTYAGIAISGGTAIPWFFIAYSVILLLFWKNNISFLTAFGAGLLSSLAFTHFHPQWLVWLMPWMVIWAIKNESMMVYLAAIFGWFCVLFSFDPTLHYAIFLAAREMSQLPLSIQNMSGQILLMGRAVLIGILVYLLATRRSEGANRTNRENKLI
ncbi:MAG: hypothetical protein WC841_01440 [Candidatus Shapirobacteria bacterium]|jgi:hypothetical protein